MATPAPDTTSAEGERRHQRRIDTTINMPTILGIATMIVTTAAWAVGLYYNFDKRQTMTEIALINLSQRVDKIEIGVSTTRADQIVANNALRTDLKADIGEVKQMLDRLMFPPSANQRQLKEWSKD